MALFGLFGNKAKNTETLENGLQNTREGLFSRLTRVVAGKSTIDEEVLDNLEETLIASDVGVDTTIDIIGRIEQRVRKDKYVNVAELNRLLQEEICELLNAEEALSATSNNSVRDDVPYVIVVVGVNGVGKTTTIAKLANLYIQDGRSVVIGAADTFRAAATEQLEEWSKRVGATLVKQQQGADPASVAYDAVAYSIKHQTDVVIIDTAGRLHNKVNLMNELTKIKNVTTKQLPSAPNEIMLVLDGSTGQNAYRQAEEFAKATQITALAITKLDGTARGGVVLGISHKFKIPVKYIGVGEGVDDLLPFNAEEFVKSLFQ